MVECNHGGNKMLKIKLIALLLSIIITVIALGITSSAATYKYDDLGRVTEVTYESGQKMEYTYDAGGNVLSAKDVSIIKLNPIGNKAISVGEELKFTASGVAQQGSTLAYTASNLPEGAVINSQTGEFSWIPTSSQVGVYTKVTFQVTDGTNTSKQEITITVKSKVIKGDIDGNGMFNSIDFAYMRLYLIGDKDFTEGQLEAADVDNNGEINSIDFAIMRQVILGIKSGF